MPQDNLETVRGLMRDHMTPQATLYQAVEPLCDEVEALRRGLAAVVERVEALEAAEAQPLKSTGFVSRAALERRLGVMRDAAGRAGSR